MFAILLAVAVSLFIIYIIQRKGKKLPPGPQAFPFIGNSALLKRLSRELGGTNLALKKLSEDYNTNVLGLHLGKNYLVVVFSYPLVKTVLSSDEYDGRPDDFFMKLRTFGSRKGITGTDGELWNELRSFVIRHLRDVGLGKTKMNEHIDENLKQVLNNIEQAGPCISLKDYLPISILSVLWKLVNGATFHHGDPALHDLLKLLDARTIAFDMTGGILNQFPWLRYIAPDKTGYTLLTKLNRELREFLMGFIDFHFDTWTPHCSGDIIHFFITEMKRKGPNSFFTYEQLIAVCLDLFVAGSQTTSNTLRFAFLIMLLNPQIQVKVQQVIDEVEKNGEKLTYAKRCRAPYIEAVLLEIYRMHGVVPFSGPRRVLRDTILDGYYIPKDTTVLISLESVHRDPTYWKDADCFKPERFLNDKGELTDSSHVIPFGLGRRRCIGDSLARNYIFTFFVGILKRFFIAPIPGQELPSSKPLSGITLMPRDYKAYFIRRDLVLNGLH